MLTMAQKLKKLFQCKSDKNLNNSSLAANPYNRLLAIFLLLVPNIFFVLLNISYYHSVLPTLGKFNILLVVLLHMSFGGIIFGLFLFSRYFYIVFCFIILCLNCVVSYYKKVYSSHLTTEIVDYIIHSDTQGIRDHLDIQIFLWVMLFAIIPTALMIKFSKGVVINLRDWLSRWVVCLYIFMALCFCGSKTSVGIKYYLGSMGYILPYNYIMVIEEFFAQYLNKSETLKVNSFIPETKHQHQNMVAVLIIGESARYDHFSINGYERPTSPNLLQTNNLISFSNATSLATYTSIGVPKMVQNINLDNHVSLIKMMELNGFKTFWISNHRKHGDLVTDVALESQIAMFRDDIHPKNSANKYDQALLDKLDEVLKNHPNQNIFIVLHAIGSHLNYDLRYPEEFMIYSPTCKRNYSFFGRDSCTEVENLTNSYDNSILYSDYILSQIFAKLSPYNSFAFFASDHGQSLGENGVYFHGAEYETAPQEQVHIAMFMWASPKFLANPKHRTFFTNAAKAKDSKVSHAHLFHSIPHCMGLEKNIDPRMSICK